MFLDLLLLVHSARAVADAWLGAELAVQTL
jgi:hypothetical protein